MLEKLLNIKFTKEYWLPVIKNKYFVATIAFILWVLIFDQNNLIERFTNVNHYHQLEQDINYYQERIDANTRRLHELRTDRKNLEKFAREEYFMKKDNEQIFIIIEE